GRVKSHPGAMTLAPAAPVRNISPSGEPDVPQGTRRAARVAGHRTAERARHQGPDRCGPRAARPAAGWCPDVSPRRTLRDRARRAGARRVRRLGDIEPTRDLVSGRGRTARVAPGA